jgi:hypothetical protein
VFPVSRRARYGEAGRVWISSRRLDTETGLTLGYDEVFELPGLGMVGCEVRFADYREIEGVQIPFNCTVKYATPMLLPGRCCGV